MLDLIIRNANLPDGRRGMDIAVENGCIVEAGPKLDAQAKQEIDATDRLATPPFVDSHFHMDSTLSYGQPRVNESGTLLEGIELWGELKPHLTVEHIKARATQLCHWAIARCSICTVARSDFHLYELARSENLVQSDWCAGRHFRGVTGSRGLRGNIGRGFENVRARDRPSRRALH